MDVSIELLIGLAAIVLVIVWLALSLTRVAPGQECTVERGGRYQTTLTAGVHLVPWPIARIGARQDIRERAVALPTLHSLTRDQVPVDVSLSCFIQVVNAAKASYEVDDLGKALEEVVATQVNAIVNSNTLTRLLGERQSFLEALPARLDAATEVWGVKVTRIDVREVKPPQALLDAITKRQTAEQEQQTAMLQAHAETVRVQEEAQRARLLADQQSRQAIETLKLEAERERQSGAQEAERIRQESDNEAERARLRAEQQARDARGEHEAQQHALQLGEELARTRHQQALRDAESQQEVARKKLEAERLVTETMQQDLERDLQRQRANAALEMERLEAELAQQQAKAETIEQQQGNAHELQRLAALAERNRAERENDLKRIVAEGAAEHARILAQAREETALADARAAAVLADAVGDRSPHFFAYLAAREYVDALRSIAAANKARVLVVPGPGNFSDNGAVGDVIRQALSTTEKLAFAEDNPAPLHEQPNARLGYVGASAQSNPQSTPGGAANPATGKSFANPFDIAVGHPNGST